MCEPTTIAMGMMIGGGAINAYGAYESGQAEAELGRMNATVLRQRAVDATNRGGSAAGRARMEGSDANAVAKTQLAKSGVDLSSDMAKNIFETTGMTAELDAQTAKANAAREAWGLETSARESEFQAKMAKRRGILGAAGTLLSAGGSAYLMGAKK